MAACSSWTLAARSSSHLSTSLGPGPAAAVRMAKRDLGLRGFVKPFKGSDIHKKATQKFQFYRLYCTELEEAVKEGRCGI